MGGGGSYARSSSGGYARSGDQGHAQSDGGMNTHGGSGGCAQIDSGGYAREAAGGPPATSAVQEAEGGGGWAPRCGDSSAAARPQGSDPGYGSGGGGGDAWGSFTSASRADNLPQGSAARPRPDTPALGLLHGGLLQHGRPLEGAGVIGSGTDSGTGTGTGIDGGIGSSGTDGGSGRGSRSNSGSRRGSEAGASKSGATAAAAARAPASGVASGWTGYGATSGADRRASRPSLNGGLPPLPPAPPRAPVPPPSAPPPQHAPLLDPPKPLPSDLLFTVSLRRWEEPAAALQAMELSASGLPTRTCAGTAVQLSCTTELAPYPRPPVAPLPPPCAPLHPASSQQQQQSFDRTWHTKQQQQQQQVRRRLEKDQYEIHDQDQDLISFRHPTAAPWAPAASTAEPASQGSFKPFASTAAATQLPRAGGGPGHGSYAEDHNRPARRLESSQGRGARQVLPPVGGVEAGRPTVLDVWGQGAVQGGGTRAQDSSSAASSGSGMHGAGWQQLLRGLNLNGRDSNSSDDSVSMCSEVPVASPRAAALGHARVSEIEPFPSQAALPLPQATRLVAEQAVHGQQPGAHAAHAPASRSSSASTSVINAGRSGHSFGRDELRRSRFTAEREAALRRQAAAAALSDGDLESGHGAAFAPRAGASNVGDIEVGGGAGGGSGKGNVGGSAVAGAAPAPAQRRASAAAPSVTAADCSSIADSAAGEGRHAVLPLLLSPSTLPLPLPLGATWVTVLGWALFIWALVALGLACGASAAALHGLQDAFTAYNTADLAAAAVPALAAVVMALLLALRCSCCLAAGARRRLDGVDSNAMP